MGSNSILQIWTSVQAYSCNKNLENPESKSLNRIGKLDQDKNLMESYFWIRQSHVDKDACIVVCLRIGIFLSKPIPAMKTWKFESKRKSFSKTITCNYQSLLERITCSLMHWPSHVHRSAPRHFQICIPECGGPGSRNKKKHNRLWRCASAWPTNARFTRKDNLCDTLA